MMVRPYFSGDFRARARLALKKNLPTAAVVYFLAMLPQLAASAYGTIQRMPLAELVNNYAVKSMSGEPFSMQTMLNDMQALLTNHLILSIALELLAAIITPALTMGAMAAVFKLLRGGEIKETDVFSRIGCFFKGIGVVLLTTIKVFLWMLPGMAVSVLAVVATMFTKSMQVGMVLTYAGSILMFVLGIRAALHYALAVMIVADEPSTGVFQSIRRSIQLMRYRKQQLVMLYLSFLLWMMLANIVTGMFMGAGAVYYIVDIVCTLAINLYMMATMCAFYDVYKDHPSTKQETVMVRMMIPRGQMGQMPFGQQPPSDEQTDDDDDDDDDDNLLN